MLNHLEKPRERHLHPGVEAGEHVLGRQPFGGFAGARIAETAGSERHPPVDRELLDAPVVQQMPVRIVEIQRNRPAAHHHRRRSVDADQGTAVAVPQREQLRQHPCCQAGHPRLERRDADTLEMTQTRSDGRDSQIVERPVFEAGFLLRENVRPALHRCEVDRAARKPRSCQFPQDRVAHDETADAGRIPEHLVEGDADEIRVNCRQIEAIGRNERRCVEQHVPTRAVRFVDDVERVLHPGKIRLRRKGEQVVAIRIGRLEQPTERLTVDPQVGHRDRRVLDAHALRLREFADAVHRVVIVDGEETAPSWRERIRFARRASMRRSHWA